MLNRRINCNEVFLIQKEADQPYIMPIDRQAAIDRLRAFDFSGLFTRKLGWDWYTAETKIKAARIDLTLKGIAEKRGVHVFHCPSGADGLIPDAAMCAIIEREVAKIAREHLLIFTDAVFRDCAFADDVAKTNLAAILDQHGLGNVRSI